jgi:hypothetical protein
MNIHAISSFLPKVKLFFVRLINPQKEISSTLLRERILKKKVSQEPQDERSV